MSSKRNLSIGIISILILSAFTTATVPMTSAISDPYIIVYPSSVSPGQTVYVRGYHFEPGNTVDIYCDVVDEYHHLGSAHVNWYGRFYFSFKMEEGYPGTCTIIAVNPPDAYTAEIELSYTNPLDQRLVNLIGSQSIDIEAKLDTILERIGTPGSAPLDTVFNALSAIYGAVDTMEADLKSWMDTNLKTNIDNIWSLTGNTHGWGNLATSLDDIKGELDSWFGTDGKYNNTTQIVAGQYTVPLSYIWEVHIIFSQSLYKTAKITITIATEGIDPGEALDFAYNIGGGGSYWFETIAEDTDPYPQTYEFCFSGDLWLIATFSGIGDFIVYYSYVVEYQP